MRNALTAHAALLATVAAIAISCDRDSPICLPCSKPSELELAARNHAAESSGELAIKRKVPPPDPGMSSYLHAQLGFDARDTCAILRAGTGAARAGGEREFKAASDKAERLCDVWTKMAAKFETCLVF